MVQEQAAARLDKWLWAARFYKTRSLAAQAITGGKVHLNSARVKAAHRVNIGDSLCIRRGEFEWTITVLGLSTQRRPAAEAALLYEESETSLTARTLYRERRRMQGNPRPKGRPDKKQRRDLIRVRRQD